MSLEEPEDRQRLDDIAERTGFEDQNFQTKGALHEMDGGRNPRRMVDGTAVRIQRQDLAREVAAGPAQFTQGHLELLSLLDGVDFQQVINGAISG